MSDKALNLFTIGQGCNSSGSHWPCLLHHGRRDIRFLECDDRNLNPRPRLLDNVIGGPSNSGNYFVYAIPQSKGECKTFKLVWVTATAGIPTTTQVTAAVALTAETVRLLVIGR